MKTIRLMSLGLSFLCATTPISAQDRGSEYVNFRFHTVARDGMPVWESLIRERRAADLPFLRVFQRLRGPEPDNTFLILHDDVWIDPAGQPAANVPPAWRARVDTVLESTALLTVEMPPELAANLEGWLALDAGDLMLLRIRTVAAGRVQDYRDWQVNELIPALRDAGIRVRGGQIFLGGSTRTFMSLSIVEDWAALTASNSALSSREFQRMIATGEQMVVSSENHLYQYRGDLSYLTQ